MHAVAGDGAAVGDAHENVERLLHEARVGVVERTASRSFPGGHSGSQMLWRTARVFTSSESKESARAAVA